MDITGFALGVLAALSILLDIVAFLILLKYVPGLVIGIVLSISLLLILQSIFPLGPEHAIVGSWGFSLGFVLVGGLIGEIFNRWVMIPNQDDDEEDEEEVVEKSN